MNPVVVRDHDIESRLAPGRRYLILSTARPLRVMPVRAPRLSATGTFDLLKRIITLEAGASFHVLSVYEPSPPAVPWYRVRVGSGEKARPGWINAEALVGASLMESD